MPFPLILEKAALILLELCFLDKLAFKLGDRQHCHGNKADRVLQACCPKVRSQCRIHKVWWEAAPSASEWALVL